MTPNEIDRILDRVAMVNGMTRQESVEELFTAYGVTGTPGYGNTNCKRDPYNCIFINFVTEGTEAGATLVGDVLTVSASCGREIISTPLNPAAAGFRQAFDAGLYPSLIG